MNDTPVNLNRVRKAKARAAKKARADENAVKHGRSKTRKAQEASELAKTRHDLDQHRLREE
jgi:hypothetical protein